MACNRPDCNNGRRDGDETEIDCGGSCPDCPPSVTTKPVSSISTTSATLSMDYWHTTGTSKSSEGFMEKGFCYGTVINPTKDNFVTAITGTFNASGDYTTSITGLTSGTTYYVRAYVKDETAIAYGNEISFTTLSSGITVTTDSVTAIALSTATCGGNVTSGSGLSILQKGLCYGTTPAPTVNGDKTSNGTGAGTFSVNLTGLAYPVTYYVRAYANYSGGTIYGNEVSFTTGTISVPTVNTTTNYTNTPTASSFYIEGNVTSSGNGTVTARGFCYGTTPNPTLSNSITNNGSGTGLYASNLFNLSPNTTYYARAYATNIAGTGYGNQISFTTAPSSFTIGQSYQGGLIAYIDNTGLHGFIVATSDQSFSIAWWNGTNTQTNATATAIGTGQANTSAIISSQGNTGSYAAKKCADLILGGYNDWYLPSKDELNQLYVNRVALGLSSNALYWSSTEFSTNSAMEMVFSNATFYFQSKSSTYSVRAIRSF